MESMPPWFIFSCYFFFSVPFSFNKIIFLSFWNIDLVHNLIRLQHVPLHNLTEKNMKDVCNLKKPVHKKNLPKKNLVLLSVHACRSKISTQCYKCTNVSLVGDPSCPADIPHCLRVLPSHEVASLRKGVVGCSQGIHICVHVWIICWFSVWRIYATLPWWTLWFHTSAMHGTL